MGGAPDTELDPRVRTAWRSWLSALATDAEAAMAAALAYESLPVSRLSSTLNVKINSAAKPIGTLIKKI